MTHLIQVTDAEWEAAKNFFEQEREAVKFKARDKAKHSFIRVGGEIFVMETKGFSGHLLGEGASGKVRMVQTETGDNFAVKIEARGLRGEENAEIQIMKLLHYIKGEAVVDFISNKKFKGKSTTQKLYTVIKLKKGDELQKKIYFNKYKITRKKLKLEEKLNISLNACKAVQVLHEKKIIHADIKPANFMANNEGEEILIESIDYGISLKLSNYKTERQLFVACGTLSYMAPEIRQTGTYSYSSDIYALGKMLGEDLLLKDKITDSTVIGELIKKMCDPDRGKRPILYDIIHQFTLAQMIEKTNEQDPTTTIETFLDKFTDPEKSNYTIIALKLLAEQKKLNSSLITYFIQEINQKALVSDFKSRWSLGRLEDKYLMENRNIIPKINPSSSIFCIFYLS